MRGPDWTPEEDAVLARMAAEGHGTRAIGAAVNRSRCSVIGRAFRNGLRVQKPRVARRPPPVDMPVAKPMRDNRQQALARRQRMLARAGTSPVTPCGLMGELAVAFSQVAQGGGSKPGRGCVPEIPGFEPLRVPFLKLRSRGQCKFPLWPHGAAPELDAMFFCGHGSSEGESYCTHHKARCISPPVMWR